MKIQTSILNSASLSSLFNGSTYTLINSSSNNNIYYVSDIIWKLRYSSSAYNAPLNSYLNFSLLSGSYSSSLFTVPGADLNFAFNNFVPLLSPSSIIEIPPSFSLALKYSGSVPTTGNSTLQIDVYYDTQNVTDTAPIFNFESPVALTGSLRVSGSIDTTSGSLIYNDKQVIDWNNQLLRDTSNVTSIDWKNRKLINTSNNPTFVWNNGGTLYDGNGTGSSNVVFDIGNRFINSTNGSSIDLTLPSLNDQFGSGSVYWDSRILSDQNNNTALSWVDTSSDNGVRLYGTASNALTASYIVPAGTSYDIQYNAGGILGGYSYFQYNPNSQRFTINTYADVDNTPITNINDFSIEIFNSYYTPSVDSTNKQFTTAQFPFSKAITSSPTLLLTFEVNAKTGIGPGLTGHSFKCDYSLTALNTLGVMVTGSRTGTLYAAWDEDGTTYNPVITDTYITSPGASNSKLDDAIFEINWNGSKIDLKIDTSGVSGDTVFNGLFTIFSMR